MYTSEFCQTIQWSWQPDRQHHPSVYWQVTATALGRDLCLLASACLAKDSSAYNCIERQWKQYQFTDEVTFLSHRRHSSAKFFWLQTSSLIYTSHHQLIRTSTKTFDSVGMNTVILWLSKILWMVDEIQMIRWDVNINVIQQHTKTTQPSSWKCL